MFSKVSIAVITMALLLYLGGCSTTKPVNVVCDFIVGATDNAIERDNNKNKSDIHGNQIKNSQNSDVFEGILNILGGVFTRIMNNDSNDKCT